VTDADLVRSTFGSVLEGSTPDTVVARLSHEGWGELVLDDPATAVGVLFEELGRRGAPAPVLDVVVATAVGVALDDGDAVVHPGSAAPALVAGRVDGVLLAGAPAQRLVLVGDEAVWAQTPDALDIAAIAGLDPALELRAVRGEVSGATRLAATGAWPEAAAPARRALAHELVGVTEAMLAVALAQVSERQQFGKPIGTFQAVQHRLADVQVALDAARAVLAAAWRRDDPVVCDASKALAGRAALLAAKHTQQVCGAIGFTTEHPLPALIRRAHVLDRLYGTAAELQERLGTHLLDTGAAPRLATPWSAP
jgi:alkylation response protein AidB-like acyl-CoA dehydrogenase